MSPHELTHITVVLMAAKARGLKVSILVHGDWSHGEVLEITGDGLVLKENFEPRITVFRTDVIDAVQLSGEILTDPDDEYATDVEALPPIHERGRSALRLERL